MPILRSKRIDTEFLDKITRIYKDEGNLDDYDFEIEDPTIDLFELTPYVKEHMGTRYCIAHLRALKLCKDKLNAG
jgi:hypothetical protein